VTSPPGLRARLCAQIGPLAIDAELDTGPGTLVLIGPNGAGKTSLLSLLLGTMPSHHARIQVGNEVLLDTDARLDVPVERRRLGYVPQTYALFPHLSVRENVAFAVRSAVVTPDAAQTDERVDTALRALGISELGPRMTHNLSGGERQRVALARALSIEPRALLLDEPLAALDVHARDRVRAFLSETLKRLALPTIVVTHDAADARVLGQRITVLEAGRVTQTGAWDELALEPASAFVRQFVAESRCPSP
jgi:molybdate transport system ATP-binding protein